MEFIDMSEEQRNRVVRWCKRHDWGQLARMNAYGTALLLTAESFTNTEQLLIWAGY